MRRLTIAAVLSVVAAVLLFGTPYALLASAVALCALVLSYDPKLLKEAHHDH